MKPNPPLPFIIRLAGGVATTLVMALTACAAPPPAAPVASISTKPPGTPTHTVRIANFTFDARTLTIPIGATITWINDDDIPHTVVSNDRKLFRSKVLDTGDTFSFTFSKVGEVRYFCSVHPHMTGKVVVTPK